MPGDFTVLKAVGPTPYREHELGDELFRAITTVAAGLRQIGSGKGRLESQVIEHPFHQSHAAPGSDFLVAKTKVKFHVSSPTEIAIAYFSGKIP